MTASSDDHECYHAHVQEVTDKMKFRERGALGLIPVLGICGIALIATSRDKVPAKLAAYIAGVGLCQAAVTMVIAWGAASGHSTLAEYAAADHARLFERLNGRVGDVETFEREQVQVLTTLADEVGSARRRHGEN